MSNFKNKLEKNMTPKELYFKKIQSALETTKPSKVFKTRTWKKALDLFEKTYMENGLPDELIVFSTKHLFTSDENRAFKEYLDEHRKTVSISNQTPKYIIDLYYNRWCESLCSNKLTRTQLNRYLYHDLELHKQDAKFFGDQIHRKWLKYELPSPEALILTSDLFTVDEISDLLYYANRVNDVTSEYSKRLEEIDTVTIYAQSKKSKTIRKQRQEVRKESTYKQVLEAEYNMHSL